MTDVTIRPPAGVAEIERCVALQQEVWGFPDREVVPVSELTSVGLAGGYLRVAEAPGAGLVGFCFGFWGRAEGRAMLYSRMLAVLPAWRGHGLALRLKSDQRDFTLAAGADRIHWTCDPLVAVNARLNFARLGTECDRYLVDLYGARANFIQRGLPTDRLSVRWHLAAPAVAARLEGQTRAPDATALAAQAPALLRADGTAEAPAPVPGRVPDDAARLRVEIPAAIESLRERDAAAALAWRLAVREALQGAFARGYRITDFAPARAGAPAAGAYLLTDRRTGGQAESPGVG